MTGVKTHCDVCNRRLPAQPCHPHEPGCARQGCVCDAIVCPSCCWDELCEAHEATPDDLDTYHQIAAATTAPNQARRLALLQADRR